MPLNELMAMLSGSQVNAPQFQMATPTQIQPPPIFQAAQATATNANNTATSAIGGLAKMGAAAIPLMSDRRLKENIVRVGATPAGVPVYEYNLLGSDERTTGVMAQELLETQPDAVSVGDDGFYRVDYSKVQ
jgi:hypothetical protein